MLLERCFALLSMTDCRDRGINVTEHEMIESEVTISALLEQIRIISEQIILTTGYGGVAFLMFVENIFPPIPSEVVMPFAGFLVHRGQMSFLGVLLAGTLGAILGAVAIYAIGRSYGEDRLRQWVADNGKYLLLSVAELDSSLDTFEEHGQKMILLGRLIPTIRSLISIPAGLEKMNLPVFLLLTLAGTVIWNLLLMGGGVILGQNWTRVLTWVDTYAYVVYAMLGLLLLVFVVKRLKNRDLK